MSATRLYKAGYHALVSVVPPKADLAPTTTLRATDRGKVPGRPRRDGRWVGYPWLTDDPPTEQDVQRWDDAQANVGLMASYFPGLDLDIDHPVLAKLVEQEAHKILGPAPVRLSSGSRRLLVYRTTEPFPKNYATIDYKGEQHVAEFLCEGRQYLVHGVHPSGDLYRWAETPLWEIAPEDLTEITVEQAQAFLQHLQTLLEGRAHVTVQGAQAKANGEIVYPAGQLSAPSLEDLERVVALIPNAYPDRDDYIRMGHAIKAAGGDEAFPVFLEWAERWEDGDNDPDTVRADWSRMHPPFRVGWSWLTELAEELGEYVPAQDEFDASEEALEVVNLEGVIAHTDTWVAERIAALVAPRIRFVPMTGHWHVWNGYAWQQDQRNEAQHIIRRGLVDLSLEVREQAARTQDEKDAERLFKVAHALQSRNALTKVVPELQAHPALTLVLDQFDADPWTLNTPDGIVDLTTGKMRPSDPTALMSKATRVGPKQGPAKDWYRFLDEATDGDEELQRFLQKQVGYALTGNTDEQTFSFIHGPGGTGKSTFIDAVSYVLGSYHEVAAADTFAAAKSDRHPTDLAKLAGARLVTAVETQEGRAWDTQRIKSITGGDRISARFMRQDFFDYKPTFKIIIVGNHEPTINGVDDAMFRRLHIVPFEHPPEEVDRLLMTKLHDEAPQILAWAIEGCLLWQQEGLAPPEAVLLRTAEYRQEEDPVGIFIEERCVVDPEGEVTRQDLYQAWSQWCHGQGEDPGSLKQLKRRFGPKEAKYKLTDTRLTGRVPGDRPRGYRGIRLKEEVDLI